MKSELEKLGQKIGEIPVKISYRIIELFSGSLYSSPNKAFEELVCNSYDAFATKVGVYVPNNLSAGDAVLWVCDDGESMDSSGLKALWKIGVCNKRAGDRDSKERPPIGKFGIGKLATYVLARKLTYICKARGEYRAVTMDYGMIDPASDEPTDLKLDERLLTEQEVVKLLKPLIERDGEQLLEFNLWGKGAEKTWTFAIMSDLRPKAQEIQEGRLRWILSTALPMSPRFNLTFNGKRIESSKADAKPLKIWVIGKDDVTAQKFKDYSVKLVTGKPFLDTENIKNIHGFVELYSDSLVKGKSEKLGRSHGIFLMVRNRLVNLDDPLLGMSAMTHGVFNRFRMVIHADALDEELTSTRESIKDSAALRDVQKYIQRKFEEVKEFYFKVVEQAERVDRASYKVSQAASSLSRRPLLVVARKFFNNELGDLVLIDIPRNLSKTEQRSVITRLEEDLTSESGLIKDVVWVALAPEDPVAKLDLMAGTAKINLLHPLFANFLDEVKSKLPFQLMAVTEILTEASLIEDGMPQEHVKRIMWRRDQLLRDLTFSDKPNAPLVSQMLKAALGDSSGLEDAVFWAFNALDFETTKIGGKGKPDGKAVATLGVRADSDGRKADYSFVYDAKSTSKDKIKATTAHTSGIDRHRDTYKADYAVVVAVDFEGAMDPESAVSAEAKKHKITLLRAADLMTLVLIAAPKQLGYLDFKELFDKCHTVIETAKWVEEVKKREVKKQPIREMLETVYKLMRDDNEPPELAAIRMAHQELKKHTKEELRKLVQSLERIVGRLISIDGDLVSIQASPDRIMECINAVVSDQVPHEFLDVYLKAFEDTKRQKQKK